MSVKKRHMGKIIRQPSSQEYKAFPKMWQGWYRDGAEMGRIAVVQFIFPSLAEIPWLCSALEVQGLGPGPCLAGADCPGCLTVGNSHLPRVHRGCAIPSVV